MNSFRLLDRRTGYFAAAVAMLFATIIPALVSAAQVTERSIALSSSSADANGVSYQVNFKAVQAAGAFVVDFCSDSPILGQTCTPPVGFDVTNVSTTGDFTASDLDTNTAMVVGAIAEDENVSVSLAGINNPTNDGPLYARIVTYTADTIADGYTSADPDVDGTHLDDGGVAISITDTVGVQGAVLETLTFCVSAAVPTQNCGGVTSPVLELGQDVGDGKKALTAGVLSTGNLFTQISTNAASGAIVSLKSNALNCGGLLRAGALSACDITPALTGGTITGGQAKFGVLAASATDPTGAGTPTGTFQTANGSTYNATTYELDYVAGNATGVTSVYGDPILDTDDAPISNKNMQLTFGASISSVTPAGLYSADLSMIATGKF